MPETTLPPCLFCRIAAGSLPATRLYEDDTTIAFADLHPQAPVHVLFIPRVHIASTSEAMAEHGAMLGHLIVSAAQLAREKGLDEGYRLVFNTGTHGGQTVPHLHLHLLGGRPMGWPPG